MTSWRSSIQDRALVSSRVRNELPSPHGKVVERALKAIDSVHTDGVLKVLRMHDKPNDDHTGTYFAVNGEIGLNLWEPETPHLNVCHEIGHWLDHKAIDMGIESAGYRASERSDRMVGWIKAVKNSDSFRVLESYQEDEFYQYQADYLLSLRELWARSYAQYICVKSWDECLNNELTEILSKPEEFSQKQQWTGSDFRPILHQIDLIFSEKNWLTAL